MSFRLPSSRAVFPLLAVAAAVVYGQDAGTTWQVLLKAAREAAVAKNFPRAEKLYGQATEETARFPPDDARTGITFNELGLICKEEKKYPDAAKAFRKALEILEDASGPKSLDVGNVAFNIASVTMAQGHYDEALPYISRSRDIYLNILGPDSLKATSTLCMRGESYRNLKKFNEAQKDLKECADAREAAGGVASADFADALFDLALLYEQEGRPGLAEPALKLAGKIREIALGVTSPEFAEALEAHAALLKTMGRGPEADKESEMAAAIRRNLKPTQ